MKMKAILTPQAKIISVAMILFLAAFGLRIYKITEVPWSLNWDEAAFGYNAYSLLLTGRDEYGSVMPLQFLSVGDYKCPLYIYLLVPAIKLFGLNEWAVRLVPALLGAFTIPLTYIIASTLFNKRVGGIAGFLLAISPWHLQFTRAGADVAVSSFMLMLGLALALRKKMAAAGLFLGLSAYAYFGERAFMPLLALLLIAYFKKGSIKLMAPLIIVLLPLGLSLASSGHLNKIANTSLLGYQPDLKATAAQDPSWAFWLFHNINFEKGRMAISRYAEHFSPVFLFTQKLEDGRQRIDGMGMLYRSDILLLIAFGMWALNSKNRNRNLIFLLAWLLIAPIPAAITRDAAHARRAFNMIYPLSIMAAIGLNFLWAQRRRYWAMGLAWTGLFMWSVVFYWQSYYIFTPQTAYRGAAGWQYGYKPLVEAIQKYKSEGKKIVIDTSYQGPYIFFLFYEKYPPAEYQKQAKLARPNLAELGEGAGYGNYEFRAIYWPWDRNTKNTIFAGPPERIPDKDIVPREARMKEAIKFPNGTTAWKIVATATER